LTAKPKPPQACRPGTGKQLQLATIVGIVAGSWVSSWKVVGLQRYNLDFRPNSVLINSFRRSATILELIASRDKSPQRDSVISIDYLRKPRITAESIGALLKISWGQAIAIESLRPNATITAFRDQLDWTAALLGIGGSGFD
jgi:hypothetical protein